MEKQEEARAYLSSLLSVVVEKPALLVIVPTVDALGINLSVKADPVDMRILIGPKGATANAIRRVLYLWGKKHAARVNVVIY